ncbi:MAG TPA: hypothetical protein VFJ12_03335 [Segeticoccus sp.]|nr:hypothetical protein [Segeticoccus sp.]
MRTTLNLQVLLENVHCYDEADGWGSAEPYLWTCFFKVDGDSFAVESVGLIGSPVLSASNGSHGNLGDTDVDAGDDVPVPDAIGAWTTKLKPIPVNDSGLRSLIGDDLPGIAGVVVALMEEDGWPDHLADVGYGAFVDAVHLAVVKVAASFQHALSAPTQQEIQQQIDQVKAAAADAVHAAVKDAMDGWDLLWFGTVGNNDDQIGTEAFTTDSDQLTTTPAIDLVKRWTGDNGDWEIRGVVRGIPAFSCSVEELFGSPRDAAEERAMAAMRTFRDSDYRALPGLAGWWGQLERLTPLLRDLAASDPLVAEALRGLLRDAGTWLEDTETPIEPASVARFETVLSALDGRMTSHARVVLRQARRMLRQVDGASFHEAVHLAAVVKPVGRKLRVHIAPLAPLRSSYRSRGLR